MIFNNRKNVLVVGADGMFGHDLAEYLRTWSQYKKSVINTVIAATKEDFDASSEESVKNFMKTHIGFDYVVNCAGYTNTSDCSDVGKRTASYRENVIIPYVLSKYCYSSCTRFIHISTNQVFSNDCSIDKTFGIDDTPTPVNFYGMQKLIGEKMIEQNMDEPTYAILRTSWLYGMHKSKSFIHKVTRNFRKCEEDKTVPTGVCDEFSIPTSTFDLSSMVYNAIRYGLCGIHNACSLGPKVSRLGFMKRILDEYNNKNIFKTIKEIQPISSKDNEDISFVGDITLNTNYELYDKRHYRLYECVADWRQGLSAFMTNNAEKIYEESFGVAVV